MCLDLTVLVGPADELVLDGVDVDVSERREGELFPELSHSFFELRVEKLRDLVERRAAPDPVLSSGYARDAD